MPDTKIYILSWQPNFPLDMLESGWDGKAALDGLFLYQSASIQQPQLAY
jgi:hypothetical protein